MKTQWEKEKLLVMSNFSFSHSVFKRHIPETRKNQGLFGKGLSKAESCWLQTMLVKGPYETKSKQFGWESQGKVSKYPSTLDNTSLGLNKLEEGGFLKILLSKEKNTACGTAFTHNVYYFMEKSPQFIRE